MHVLLKLRFSTSDYLPYFGKINIFFNIIRGLHSMYNLIEVISSWTEQKLRSCDQFLITIMDIRGQFCDSKINLYVGSTHTMITQIVNVQIVPCTMPLSSVNTNP
jgi:hypothetical protein